MPRIISIILFIFYSIAILLINNLEALFELSFYFLLIYALYDIFRRKSFYMVHLWIISFVYIIISEGIVYLNSLDTFGETALYASKIIFISNVMVLLGYQTLSATQEKTVNFSQLSTIPSAWANTILIISVIVYTVFSLPDAINAFLIGRNKAFAQRESSMIWDILVNALGLILPATIAFVYSLNSKKRIMPVILSIPVFIVLFLGGTRYPLLFSVVGFLVIYLDFSKINFRKALIALTPTILIILITTNIMSTFRVHGTKNMGSVIENSIRENFSSSQNDDITIFLASKMSPEGVVRSYTKMVKYFADKPFLYGQSTGFIFYFWIPRSIWEDKPTMLGHWLIRAYGDRGFSKGHSASFGFAGDFYADFGFPGAIILSFLLGIGLNKLEILRIRTIYINDERKILFAMLYPYVFFVVRSPVTASMTMISILFLYKLLILILFRKNIVSQSLNEIKLANDKIK